MTKPPLSPAHGTSLATTAGITAVITVVVAVAVLGHCMQPFSAPVGLAAIAIAALLLGSAGLYSARNEIGHALDLAAVDRPASAVAAARGLTRFHLGMAGVFAGAGFAAAFRFPMEHALLGWLVPVAALIAAVLALARAASWEAETKRRASDRSPAGVGDTV